jgi:hypothetical protein
MMKNIFLIFVAFAVATALASGPFGKNSMDPAVPYAHPIKLSNLVAKTPM